MRILCIRTSGLFALLLPLVLATGCMSTMGPKMPAELAAPSTSAYSTSNFKADVKKYHDAMDAKDYTAALALRNEIAYHVMADIEANYGRFEMNLTTQRAGFETGSDAIQLGITAATTVIGAGDVKDILGASLSAFEGTRLSYDKNFFREKTTESIIAEMRAARKTKQAELIKSLANRKVVDYPWDAVWIDLIDFYYAGTVPSALVEIANTAGTKADAASTTLKNAEADLTPRTPAQAVEAGDIRAAYDKLTSATADPAKSAGAILSLKRILTAAGQTPAENASASDLLALLKAAMIEAKTDDDKLATLNQAITAEKLE